MFVQKAASIFPRRNTRKPDTASIFIHAGAGFHSKDNEHMHLQACSDACKAAMVLLKNGGSAADAVELAIAVLEDREVTNAGYGSNLTVDGVVECDAVIVDHLGRSGAVGAVAQVKNPISLARLLLDRSVEPLSLRRVPPNLLVGDGATGFARDHKMPICTFDQLISPVARGRWKKWCGELHGVERKARREEDRRMGYTPSALEDEIPYTGAMFGPRGTHERTMFDSLWNDAQPISPPPSDLPDYASNTAPFRGLNDSRWANAPSEDEQDKIDPDEDDRDEHPFESVILTCDQAHHPNESIDSRGPAPSQRASTINHPFSNSTQNITPTSSFAGMPRQDPIDGGHSPADHKMSGVDDSDELDSDPLQLLPTDGARSPSQVLADRIHYGESEPVTASADYEYYYNSALELLEEMTEEALAAPLPESSAGSTPTSETNTSPPQSSAQPPPITPRPNGRREDDRDDHITDTVGAIAVDQYGNIAAGASSGGIGIKHSGRVGPAALVGVGASVLPADPDDPDGTCVATVTSGTGEHMATTMAAHTCSDRVYHNVRKVPGGGFVSCDGTEEHPADAEDGPIKCFIERDFMGHPSVRHSASNGAIGMLSVKKTRDGLWFHFGHNTDSFALASMHANESTPRARMSRNQGNGSIAQGAYAIRFGKGGKKSKK